MRRQITLGIITLSLGLLAPLSLAQASPDSAKDSGKQDRNRNDGTPGNKPHHKGELGAERRAEIKERRAERKAERKAREEAESKERAERKAERKAEREARNEKPEAPKSAENTTREQTREQRRENEVDHRQARQERRIDHGIAKGYLTSEEITKLESQQSRINALENTFKSDSKLSRDEFKTLNSELDTASRCIWAEKHDTDGKQMPTYRLGRNVFARNDFTAKMANEDLPAPEAKALTRDFHRMLYLKKQLATHDLTPGQRAAYQDEFNTLLNTYFEIR